MWFSVYFVCVWRFWSPIFWCRVCRVMWTSSWMVNSMWFKRSLALEDVRASNCIDGKCTHATMSHKISSRNVNRMGQHLGTSWDVRRPWQHRTVWFAALWRVSVIRWPSSWSGPEMVLRRGRNGWHGWNIQNIPPFREEKKNEKAKNYVVERCFNDVWCPCETKKHGKLNRWLSMTFHIFSMMSYDPGEFPSFGEASPPMLRIRSDSDFALPGSHGL